MSQIEQTWYCTFEFWWINENKNKIKGGRTHSFYLPWGDPYKMSNIKFVQTSLNFSQFSKTKKKSGVIAEIWSLELKNLKIGATILFPEDLGNTYSFHPVQNVTMMTGFVHMDWFAKKTGVTRCAKVQVTVDQDIFASLEFAGRNLDILSGLRIMLSTSMDFKLTLWEKIKNDSK